MNAQEFATEVRNGDYQVQPSIGVALCRRLENPNIPLLADVERFLEAEPPSSVTEPGHQTNWTKPFGRAKQWSLKNATGRTDDTSTDFTGRSDDKQCHLHAEYPSLAALVDQFPEAVNFRLNGMGPKSGLSIHEEAVTLPHPDGGSRVKVRFHIPLVTNDRAFSRVGDKWYHLGWDDPSLYAADQFPLFYFNNGDVHTSINNHPTAWRYHLVFDMILTEDVFNKYIKGFVRDFGKARPTKPYPKNPPIYEGHIVSLSESEPIHI